MIAQDKVTLTNGVTMPRLGFGTWRIDDDAVVDLVAEAIAAGYRHIDTAQAYGNERGVGEGVRRSGVARDDLFVTTKLSADCKDYEEAKRLIDGSLTALDIGHIDLMLIHSPQPWAEFRNGEHWFEGNLAAWRALEEAHEAGKLRAIGVSNFEAVDLGNILNNARVKPVVNQVLAHVGNTPFDLIDYCASKNVLVEAYSPVAHGAALNSAALTDMATRYDVSVAQLCIRYCLQLGLVPLPKTANAGHLRANLAVDFTISDEDMAVLKAAKHDDYGEASAFPVFAKSR